MEAAPNPFKTIVFAAAPGDEATVHSIEATVGRDANGMPVIATCWEPSDEEIAAMVRGEKVWLTIYCVKLSPAYIGVGPRPYFLEDQG